MLPKPKSVLATHTAYSRQQRAYILQETVCEVEYWGKNLDAAPGKQVFAAREGTKRGLIFVC